jgi:hypothetical protein
LEGRLSAEFENKAWETIEESRQLVELALSQLESWKQLSGPYTPYPYPHPSFFKLKKLP